MPARSTAVSRTETIIWRVRQLPRIFSAVSGSCRPIKMEAWGAPPAPMREAKAVTIIITGRQMPTPVRARLPSPGMWPM